MTSEFVNLFVGGRKYGAKLALAHQYMGQLDLPGLAVNRRGVVTAGTIVSFHTTPYDAAEVASCYAQLEKTWARDNLVANVAQELEHHANEAVKKFALRHVDPLIQGSRSHDTGYQRSEWDFGWGTHTFRPEDVRRALALLNELLYEAQKNGHVSDSQREAVVEAIAAVSYYPYQREEVDKRQLSADLSTVLNALVAVPIVEHQSAGGRTVATQLPSLPSRTAFVKVGERVYHMETYPLPGGVDEKQAKKRQDTLLRQMHGEYCSTRAAVDERILSSPCRQEEKPPRQQTDEGKPKSPPSGQAEPKQPMAHPPPPKLGRRSPPKRPEL
ncbi:hypothetical protein ABZ769_11010 [Streptomyces olivoreticuli]